MSHTDNLGPRNFGNAISYFVRQSASRFTDDLQVTDAPTLNEFVLPKSLPADCCVTSNVLNRFEDVLQAFARIPHKGIASARTRSRMRLFSPRSVTTSTLWPRSC